LSYCQAQAALQFHGNIYFCVFNLLLSHSVFLLLENRICRKISMDMNKKQEINRVDRSRAVLIKGKSQANDYVDAPPAQRVEMVWQLTQELWSLTGRTDVKQRLQRNVATLKKQ
jgi:hypothetical protein